MIKGENTYVLNTLFQWMSSVSIALHIIFIITILLETHLYYLILSNIV